MKDFLTVYNPEWPVVFTEISTVLQEALVKFGMNLSIEHVGSTSVKGMIAKPIIDIDLILHQKEQLPLVSTVLEQLGYRAKGEQGVTGRFAFKQNTTLVPFAGNNRNWTEHHLYVCYADALALKNHLLFRDALRRNEELVHEYNHLKVSLINTPDMTRALYTQAKTTFILGVLEEAGLSKNELAEIAHVNFL